MITLNCDKCDKPFEIDDDAAGEKVECPYCGDINRVPPTGVTPARARVAKPVNATPSTEAEHTITVVRQAMFRAHPFWYLLVVAVFIGGGVLTGFAKTSQQFANARWLVWVGLAMMAIGLLWWLIWWAAPHRWIKLTITNKRTVRQEGIVVRKTSEVMHNKVTNVMIRQSLLQRILNVGYIGIDSAGQGGEPIVGQASARSNIEIEVDNIPKPYEVKKVIDRYRLGDGSDSSL